MSLSPLFFWIAVTGWVAGFWLFTGRYEQAAWCVWVLFPVAVWNGRQVLDLWLGMSRESRGWWVLLGSLIGWQLLITGLRAGNWWVGPGAGKDALLVFALVSGLVMVGRDEKGRNWLWKGVFAAGLIGVLASLIAFYPEMRIHEERFRLCWRWWPGFDAVTTGIFTGMALMVGLITGENGRRWWH